MSDASPQRSVKNDPDSSSARRRSRIVWILLPAALLIVFAVVHRQWNGPMWRPSGGEHVTAVRPAPGIELPDQQLQIVRLSRYLGRQKLVIVFFDGEAGPENDRQLLLLRDGYPELRTASTEVIGVSSATTARDPQGSGRSGLFPFPLLSDVDRVAHQAWGLVDENSHSPQSAIILVDRAGQIRWERRGESEPVDVKTLLAELSRLP